MIENILSMKLHNKNLFILGILLFQYFTGMGQTRTLPSKKNEKKEDYKMLAYGLSTNTNSSLIGGLIVRHSSSIGTYKKYPMNRYLAAEVINYKHPKEKTVTSNIANRFIYGKTNYFLSVRPQIGREILFFKKNEDEGLGVSLIIAGGPSLGIQKPYLIKYDQNGRGAVEVVQFDPIIHKPGNIQGSAGIFNQPFKGIKFIPGLHLKLAANFDIHTFGDNLTGFEVGITSEIFQAKPEILSNQITSNSQFFNSGYLTIYLGNKMKNKLLK